MIQKLVSLGRCAARGEEVTALQSARARRISLCEILFYYNRVSHLPQNTVSLATPVNALFPQILSMAARMVVLVGL